MQKNRSILFIILILISVSACQKQSAPVVNPEDAWQIRDQERLQACSEVNFTQNLLLHRNTYFLFKCTGWDKKFPSLNRGIQNISPASWDHLFKPIDEVFLNDKQRRDRVFDHVRELDSKRGLDDLSRVITALNETNFYDGLKDLFVCAETPSHPSCEKRNGKELTKEEIKSAIKLVQIEPVALKAIALLISELIDSIGDDSENLREEIKKFFYEDRFVNGRLKLVSSIAQKFKQGLSPIEKEFYRKIPVTRWQDNDEPYLYTWIQKPTFTNAVFKRLTDYAVTENPNVIKDLKLLKRGYHYPVYCKPYSQQGQIDIDLKTHVDDFLNYVYENDYEEFHDYIIQNVASLQLAITFCPKLKKYSGQIAYVEDGQIERGEHSLNFVNLEKELVDLTSEVPVFDISKFITFLASRNLGDIPPNPGFLLDIATEESVEWLVDIVKTIQLNSDNYFEIIFKMLKKVRPILFDSMGVLTNEFLKNENDKKISSLSKSWLFLDQTEQNFLFNYIDRHLHKDTNYILLFKFYSTMLEEYATVSPIFGDAWSSNDESLSKSYQSLYDIVKNFSGENVLRDFDKFFSRDHIITIMKVITRGPELRRVALNRLNANLVSRYISKLPTKSYDVDFTEGDTEYARKAKKCIDSLTDNKTLYVILNNFPEECTFFKHKEISLQTFSWLAQIQTNFEKAFEINTDNPSLLDERGLLSPATMNNSIAMLRLIDEKLAFRTKDRPSTGGIKYLMDTAQKHLYKAANRGVEGYVNSIVNASEVLASYLTEGGAEHRYLRNQKISEVISDDGPKAEEMLTAFSSLLSDYGTGLKEGRFQPKLYTEDTKYSCATYVNHKIGGIPCPSKDRIKRSIKSILIDASKLYEGSETPAHGYLLQAVIPERGLQIPFDAKEQRLKRLTIKESVEMVYKLTDPLHRMNNLQIEFSEDDAYDQAYDVTNWSGLKTKRKSKEKLDIDEDEDYIKPEDELELRSSKVRMNTLDRVEITMRDVRFDMNYLGAHYKNAVAKAEDYNKVVSSKLSMFKKCVGARFCGKFFNKQQIRMGRNAVSAYPGLLDANQVEEFQFGDYMQVLLSTFVRSSSKKSRKSALVKIRIFGKKIEVPWVQTKKQLREHNGKILSKLSMLSGFSNFSRFVRDRMGRTPEEFQQSLNSEKMYVLNELMFSNLDPVSAEKEVDKILKVLSGDGVDSSTVTDNLIDWIAALDYQEQREFEELLLNSSVALSFLGDSATKIGYTLSDSKVMRYQDNNLLPLLKIISTIGPKLKAMESYWPESIKMMDLIRMANKPLRFLSDDLINNKDLTDSSSYMLLNEGFMFIKKFFAEETEFSNNGAYYLSEFLGKKENMENSLGLLSSAVDYINYIESSNQSGVSGIQILAKNLESVVEDNRFSLENLKRYVLMSTSSRICINEDDTECESNVHFDEPARLLIFSSLKNGSSKTNIEKLLDTLFKEYINDYTDMVDNLLPLIRIKLNN